MKRNVTVQLDDRSLRAAKVLAAKRGTSLTRLLADEIERLGRMEAIREENQRRVQELLERDFRMGGPPYPPRDSLHDR